MRIHPTILAAVLAGCMLFTLVPCGFSQEKRETVESRVSIKTSLPPGAKLTDARNLSLQELSALPDPPGVEKNDARYQQTRIPAFPNRLGVKEGDVVTVSGWLHGVRLMGDGDYHLRFSPTADSADQYLVAEIPDEDDVSPQLRPTIEAARNFVKSKVLGGNGPSRQEATLPNPLYIQITGQLFFNDVNVGNNSRPDAQGLHRASRWEVHPGLVLACSKQ